MVPHGEGSGKDPKDQEGLGLALVRNVVRNRVLKEIELEKHLVTVKGKKRNRMTQQFSVKSQGGWGWGRAGLSVI